MILPLRFSLDLGAAFGIPVTWLYSSTMFTVSPEGERLA